MNPKYKVLYFSVFLSIISVGLYAQGSTVTWTDLVGVEVQTGNVLVKTAGWGINNAGAASTEVLAANADGWAEFTAYATGAERYFGLSQTNTGETNVIDYAIKVASSNALVVQEGGNWKGGFGNVVDGDVLRIERTGSTVEYKRNGTTFYTSQTASTSSLLVDVSFYHTGGAINNAMVSFGGSSSSPQAPTDLAGVTGQSSVTLSWSDNASDETGYKIERQSGAGNFEPLTTTAADATNYVDNTVVAGSTYSYRVYAFNASGDSDFSNIINVTIPSGQSGGNAVTWTDLVGVEVQAGNVLVKTAGWGINNAGAASTEVLAANTGGWAEFTAYATGAERYFGLSQTNTGETNVIDYAIKLSSSNVLVVQEGGTAKGGFGNIVDGDVLRIERTGSTVEYKKNGTTFYTSQTASTSSLLVDVSFYHTGGEINDAVVSFGSSSPLPQAPTDLVGVTDQSSVTLSWSDNASDETGYKIERQSGAGNFEPLTTTAADATNYVDNTVVAGNTYSYRIYAFNASGDSGFSNTVSVTIPSSQGGNAVTWTDLVGVEVQTGNVLVKTAGWGISNAGAASTEVLAADTDGWAEFTAYATGYERYFGLSQTNTGETNVIDYAIKLSSSNVLVVQEGGTAKGGFGNIVDGDVLRIERTGGTINYKKNGSIFYTSQIASTTTLLVDVSLYHTGGAINDARVSFEQSTVVATPSNLTANAASSTSIALSWSDNSSDETAFEIVRSNTSGSGFTLIHSTGADVTSYTDEGLTEGTTYYYKARAVRSGEYSGYTVEVEATTLVNEGDVADAVELAALRDIKEASHGLYNVDWPELADWPTVANSSTFGAWQGVAVVSYDIHELFLSYNDIYTYLPQSLVNLAMLKRLELANTQLYGLPDGMAALSNLEYLDVSNNNLLDLDHEIGTISSLKTLYIDSYGDGLRFDMSGLQNLEVLSATNIGFSTFPTGLTQLTQIRYLNLSYNTLDAVPEAITTISALEELDLSNNKLEDLPSGMGAMPVLAYVNVANNLLDFGDLEQFFDGVNQPKFGVEYYGQDNLPAQTLSFVVDQPLTILNNRAEGLQNIYQWQEWNGSTWEDIPGANDVNFSLASTSSGDDLKKFRCEIRNNWITDLVIYSSETELKVQAGSVLDATEIAVLHDLYNSTGGNSWTNNTGWPGSQAEWDAITSIDEVATWNGINVFDGDVTGIVLPSNGLNGSIPVSLNDLLALQVLNFRNNSLTAIPDLGTLQLKELNLSQINMGGNIPTWITDITSLEKLLLDGCGFTGEVPAALSQMSSLNELSLADNNFSGALQHVAELPNLQYLNLSYNNFEEIPSFPPASPLTQIHLQGNISLLDLPDFTTLTSISHLTANNTKLSFDDLERNQSIANFVYAPQENPVITVEIPLGAGQSIINDRSGGSSTTYQWQIWDGTDWINIDGATSSNYSPSAVTLADRYRCEMKNSLFSDVTMYSSEFLVSEIINNFYLITDGNWNDLNVWSNQPSGTPSGHLPGPNDIVHVENYTVRVSEQVECGELKLNGNTPGRVEVSGGYLIVNGKILLKGVANHENLIVSNEGKIECR